MPDRSRLAPSQDLSGLRKGYVYLRLKALGSPDGYICSLKVLSYVFTTTTSHP